MKRFGIIALVLVLTLSLAGCRRRQNMQPSTTATTPSSIAPTSTHQPTQPSSTSTAPNMDTTPTTDFMPGDDNGITDDFGNGSSGTTEGETHSRNRSRMLP